MPASESYVRPLLITQREVEMASMKAGAGDQSETVSSAAEVRRREMVLLLILASVQFTSIVDFMVVMPLGPQLQRKLEINNAQFGWIVASYTVAAGLAGLLALVDHGPVQPQVGVLDAVRGLFAGHAFLRALDRILPAPAGASCSRVHSEGYWGAWRWRSSLTFFRKNGAAARPGS